MLKNGTSKPNKKELFLSCVLSGDWKFVGDGEVILGGKSPDFININGQKKIIELFGDYWHSEKKTGRCRAEEENLRKSHFAKYGYQTLIIWESELKSPEQLVTKIIDFKGGI
jgi:G:T-mismatch repair DNA endonuclease (very short patch repair protein)